MSHSASNFVFIRVILKVKILSGFIVIYSFLGINIFSANMSQFFNNFFNSFIWKIIKIPRKLFGYVWKFCILMEELGFDVKYNIVLLKGRVND